MRKKETTDIFNVLNDPATTEELIQTALRLKYKQNYQDAQDLVQDVLIKAFTNATAGKYTEQGTPLQWIKRILFTTAVDQARKKKRSGIVLAQTDDQLQINLNTGESSPLSIELPMDPLEFLKMHIGDPDINQDQLAVLILREKGHSFKKITEILNISGINTTLGRAKYGREAFVRKYGTRENAIFAADLAANEL